MSYQVLARKWRPRSFDEMVGQEAVVQALVNGLNNDRVHHAFLLTGTRGVGKTTLARILAKCLNCEQGVSSTPCGECGSCVDVDEGRFVDMLEIDAASRTGVDDIRELIENAQYSPTRGRYKVYVIDEVHMLSRSAFNALLKTLEEPPPHVKFVMATTDADRIPVTILSRCLRFNLRRLLPGQIAGQLEKIVKSEGVDADAAAVERIARAADGSMRDGLSLLDQAIAFGGGRLQDEEVADMLGSVDHAHLAALIQAVARDDTEQMLELVGELAAQSRDLEAVLTGVAEIMHRICLLHAAPGYRDEERSDWASITELKESVPPEDAQLFYQVAIQGAQDIGLAPDPRTGLEMALLRMAAFRPVDAGSPGAPAAGATGQGPSAGAGGGKAAAGTKAASAAPRREAEPPADEPPRASAKRIEHPETLEWHDLLERLDLAGPVRELARNLELEARSGEQWQFVIPESVSHFGSKGMVRRLEHALCTQLGEPVRLVVSTTKAQVRSPASVSEDAGRRARGQAEEAIEQDPTVRSLREDMGAEIVEDSIQPLQ